MSIFHRDKQWQGQVVEIGPVERRVLGTLPVWRTEKDHREQIKEALKVGSISFETDWPKDRGLADLTVRLLRDQHTPITDPMPDGTPALGYVNTILEGLRGKGLVTRDGVGDIWSMTETGLHSLTDPPPGWTEKEA